MPTYDDGGMGNWHPTCSSCSWTQGPACHCACNDRISELEAEVERLRSVCRDIDRFITTAIAMIESGVALDTVVNALNALNVVAREGENDGT